VETGLCGVDKVEVVDQQGRLAEVAVKGSYLLDAEEVGCVCEDGGLASGRWLWTWWSCGWVCARVKATTVARLTFHDFFRIVLLRAARLLGGAEPH
jgi:hypothetical protein